jgi:hypothetical protein
LVAPVVVTRVVNLVVRVVVVATVVVVLVIDFGIPVAPVVITPVTAVGRRHSIGDVRIIVTGAGTGVAGVI